MSDQSGAAEGGVLWRTANPDAFSGTIDIAAEQLGIQPLAVEKDYWVCEALRAMVAVEPNGLVFKGGTSLEKLRIIERFSEDLDLMVTSTIAKQNHAKNILRGLCYAAARSVTQDPASLEPPVLVISTVGSARRHQHVTPPMTKSSFDGLADPGSIFIELGQSGGAHPAELASVQSLLSRALQNATDVAEFDDLRPFTVSVLHPGRTLIEKLLRMNNFSQASDAERDAKGWPRIGRQFYDVWALLGHASVVKFLQDTTIVRAVLADCATVSQSFGPDAPPPADGFAASGVFTGVGVDMARLEKEHDTAMRELYYGAAPAPTFAAVLDRVRENRSLLTFP